MSGQHLLLLGTHGHHIHSALFDAEHLKLSYGTKTEVSHNPSWLVSHPTQKEIVYCNGHEQGKAFCLKVDGRGVVEVLDEADTGGSGPTHMVVLPDLSGLVIAHYRSGNVSLIPLDRNGRFTTNSVTSAQTFHPPYEAQSHPRQEGPHAHQVVLHGEEVLVPDLGSNTIWRLRWSDHWELVGRIDGFEAGDGPRHCAVHPSGEYLYVLNELSSVLTVHTLPAPESGRSEVLDRFSILPPEDADTADNAAVMTAAEIILLAPTTPGGPSLLLCSNRDSPNPQADALALFAVSPSRGSVKRTEEGWIKGVGKHLRGLAADKSGRWVCCAARNGGGIVMYERVGEEGLQLKEISRLELDRVVVPLWL